MSEVDDGPCALREQVWDLLPACWRWLSPSARVCLLGLRFESLAGPVDVAGLDEVLETRQGRVVGERRLGVAVQELGDVLGPADHRGCLLLQGRVLARGRVLRCGDVV